MPSRVYIFFHFCKPVLDLTQATVYLSHFCFLFYHALAYHIESSQYVGIAVAANLGIDAHELRAVLIRQRDTRTLQRLFGYV